MRRNGTGEVHFNLMDIRQTVIVKKELNKSTFGSIQMRTTIRHTLKPPIPLANQSRLLQFHISIKTINQSINQLIN